MKSNILKIFLSLSLLVFSVGFSQDVSETPADSQANIMDTKEAEENAANQEAGAYERKSVSFINALWLMDKSVRNMPAEYVGYTLEKVKEKIMMPRFDYNPLPESFISEFVAKANAQEKITIDNIAAIMDETIVPRILEIVEAEKEMRAQNLTTEQQRNSFYSDKAKEFGFTAVEIEKIMNSAYIFLPVAKSYLGVTRNKKYTMKMDVGILWYRISRKGDKPKAKLMVKKMTTSMGFAKTGKTFRYDGKTVKSEEFAYRSCVKNAARNLLVATQEIPDFRLSTQVIETDGPNVGFELGKKEGLRIDDKYQIVEFMEEEDGGITQAASGWVITSFVADTNSEEGYKSKAFTVAGDPMEGVVLSEYPRIPIDILLKFKRFAYSNASDDVNGNWIDSLNVSGGMGLQINAQYNIGRYLGVSQLFFDFGYGFGSGSAEGTAWTLNGSSEITGVSNTCMDFSLVKKFYFGRIALMSQLTFGLQQVAIDAGEIDWAFTTYYYELRNSGSGLAINLAGEYALNPAINVGAGLGYQLYSSSSDWEFYGKSGATGDWADLGYTMNNEVELDHSGLQFQVYITYSPPSLPFDPIDYARGYLGL